MSGLRLLVYDRTCRGRPMLPGLSHAWGAGAWLYRSLGRLDAHRGVGSWDEALAWLASHDAGAIAEVQFWGHGKWGSARVDSDVLDARALARTHPLRPALDALRSRLAPGALWWFRTCETFGADRGRHFATAWTDFLGCRTAGHTFVIGDWQSGLHTLTPGNEPSWTTDEGLAEGTPGAPERARWSTPFAPNTVHCLQGLIPTGY